MNIFLCINADNSKHRRHNPRPSNIPTILPKIPLSLKTPIQISNDHVLTSSNINVHLFVDILVAHGELGQRKIPFVLAVFHELVYTIVGVFLQIALTDQYTDEVVLEAGLSLYGLDGIVGDDFRAEFEAITILDQSVQWVRCYSLTFSPQAALKIKVFRIDGRFHLREKPSASSLS